MCLILVAYRHHPCYRLIVAANRDEFHERPATAASWWPERADILGGRDDRGGGTWLAVNRHSAFAAITNLRQEHCVTQPRSRGLIINDFLGAQHPPLAFATQLSEAASAYEGFNLLAANTRELVWYSNKIAAPRVLDPGVYGLSNHLLDTPWPKVERMKSAYRNAQQLEDLALREALFKALASRTTAADAALPDTGVGIAAERLLAPIFIAGDTYGTRCSTVVMVSNTGRVQFTERRFGSIQEFLGEQTFEFEVEA